MSNKNFTIINSRTLGVFLKKLKFKPDVIILKNYIKINIKNIFSCPIIFLIPGIFTNNLTKYFFNLKNIHEYNKYINKDVLNQIKNSDFCFANSYHTQQILNNIYKLNVKIFCSSFIPFYGKYIKHDDNWINRKYEYGIIVSDFRRKIKNYRHFY